MAEITIHPKRVQILEPHKLDVEWEAWAQSIVIEQDDEMGEIRITLYHQSQETFLPVWDTRPRDHMVVTGNTIDNPRNHGIQMRQHGVLTSSGVVSNNTIENSGQLGIKAGSVT